MLGYAWQKVDKILFRRIFVILRAEARKDLKIGRLHFFLNIIIRGLDIISATMRSAESGRGESMQRIIRKKYERHRITWLLSGAAPL